ncbi:MAG TPA: thiamine pyrophosphate-dependent enzyme [Kiritimatiellia bacterium]|nr:thiamine pyrophosphate-dependent enzyme [Kiritimatiellia bacterium]
MDFPQQLDHQQLRNRALIEGTPLLGDRMVTTPLAFRWDLREVNTLSSLQRHQLLALEKTAARIAVQAVGELAKINEVDHLGGGLDMIPALTLTMTQVDFEKVTYTLENAHASIGYYAVLAALGHLDPDHVVHAFRRSLDIAGHVAWVPGGTQLNGGRLGVMIPTAVGQALGLKARYGSDAWVICHTGDAGWISGQALNGFNAADFHNAPITFVMHRNGIQLSGSNQAIFDKDPRTMVAAMGIEIIETPSLHDAKGLYKAYREARELAGRGRPSLIYPTGAKSRRRSTQSLHDFAEAHGILDQTRSFAAKHGVDLQQNLWIPGALMSYRDVEAMLECIFLVNHLPGGKAHHDGHLKGRDVDGILANPMLQLSSAETRALKKLQKQPRLTVETLARPRPGSANLPLTDDQCRAIKLPAAGVSTSARAGVQAGYELLAKTHPHDMFVIDCDLAPSTKVDLARNVLAYDHQFELSIEEQVATMIANGIAMSTHRPQLVVFATFAAFFEGIAREGLEMWRYQRNLNGVNEGLNVTFHLSHVGACTGRDHFSGWSLDWISLAIGYLPYLHRFYAPADARAAFVAIRDLAAHYGAHIIAIPRDNLPVLSKQDGSGPLWDAETPWEPVTTYRKHDGAKKAILALGAVAYLAGEASDRLHAEGSPVDVHIVNGLPLPGTTLTQLVAAYPQGVVTIEDGLIGDLASGFRGFAALAAMHAALANVPHHPIGITDPTIAPSDGHTEVWEHFGLTTDALIRAINHL